MSTTPLDALLQALRACPDDPALQATVVRECIARDDALAFVQVFAEFGARVHFDEPLRTAALAFAVARHERALVSCLVAGGDARRWRQVAREQLAEGDVDGARETWQRACALDGSLTDAWLDAALAASPTG